MITNLFYIYFLKKGCHFDIYRYKLDAKLAIAITCNFDNEASKEEAFVNEISGVRQN